MVVVVVAIAVVVVVVVIVIGFVCRCPPCDLACVCGAWGGLEALLVNVSLCDKGFDGLLSCLHIFTQRSSIGFSAYLTHVNDCPCSVKVWG